MSAAVECPRCGALFGASDDPQDYDWASGVSFGGIAAVRCPKCGSEMTLEAYATVTSVEVVE